MNLILALEAITGSLEVIAAFKALVEKMVQDGRTDLTDDELKQLVATRQSLENDVHS